MSKPSASDPLVAWVTGASRGIGRGVALALADAGYRVFATGRSIEAADLPETITRIRCDHLFDDEVAAAFARIAPPGSRLDLLVNCAWGGYERMVENGRFTWPLPFWDQPAHRWTTMMDTGVRSAFVASAHAARAMTARRSGLIVNLSHWASKKYIGNVIYGVSKAATDKMTADMAHELRPYGVSVLSLYPGLVRTEAVLKAAESGVFDLSNSESPEFAGRVIAALAQDAGTLDLSGGVVVVAEAAARLNVLDVDGRAPRPLTLESVSAVPA
jgi:NAD(P)-dependent dehydrogenase (short-subunit alcohol dehydrogenase family)